jgi:leader peptidase (prepilin peptidase)/N-methyltransferase
VVTAVAVAWILRLWAFAYGSIIGSFTNVVVYRVPRGLALAGLRSRCDSCGKPIPLYNNVPILTWLLLRGRASCCGAHFSGLYPLGELTGALISLGVFEVVLRSLPAEAPIWQVLVLHAACFGLATGLIASLVVRFSPANPERSLRPSIVAAVSGAAVVWTTSAMVLALGAVDWLLIGR